MWMDTSFMIILFWTFFAHSQEITHYQGLKNKFDSNRVCYGNVCGFNKVVYPIFSQNRSEYTGVCYSDESPNEEINIQAIVTPVADRKSKQNPHIINFTSENTYLHGGYSSDLFRQEDNYNTTARLQGDYTNHDGNNVKVEISGLLLSSPKQLITRLRVENPGWFNDDIYFCNLSTL